MSKNKSAIMDVYARFEETMIKGDGMYLFDDNGKKYLDFYAGIAVNSIGHCHPYLIKAIKDQVENLMHISNIYNIEGQEKLAQRLTKSSFADVVFFANSGVEAMEGMFKLARRYHFVNGNPEKWRIITVKGAFHGRSLATIAAANNPKYIEGFGPKTDGFDNVAFGDIDEIRNAINDETAAILIEPILGEGGINVVDNDYLKALRKTANEFGLLLLLDEIQTGAGRTGKMWAHQWADIKPDAIAAAKGLGGGFPIGAILATNEAAKGMTRGVHGTTFGGNPLAMAASNAVMDIIESKGFFDEICKNSTILRQKLDEIVKQYSDIFELTRGRGLMLGIKCRLDNDINNIDMVKRLKDNGLLTVGAADNMVRILPPLIMENKHIDEAIAIIAKTAEQWH